MVLLLKYWRVTLPIGLVLLTMIALQIWKADIQKAAKDAVVYEIQEQAKEQIEEGIEAVEDAFKENAVIDKIADEIIGNSYVEDVVYLVEPSGEWVQQSENSGSGLLSIGESTEVSDKRDSERGANMGNESRLSDNEIDFIQRNSGLLQ